MNDVKRKYMAPETSLEKLKAQLLLTQDTRLKRLIEICIKRIEDNKKGLR